MDDETTDGRFLGCVHERYITTASKVRELSESQPQYQPRPLGNEARQRPDQNARALGRSDGDMLRNIETYQKVAVTVHIM